MDPMLFTFLVALFIVYFSFKRFKRISIADIPGPKPDSFLLGNLYEYVYGEGGDADARWQDEFGGIIRFKGPLGEDRLFVSDPKALQYIFQTSGYGFVKPGHRREISRLFVGHGVSYAEDENHRRQRKVMLPGFGAAESKAFLPIFLGYAGKMTSQWKRLVDASGEQSTIINVPYWTSRATLDAIGDAAFDYQFGAMEDTTNPYIEAYNSIGAQTFAQPSKMQVFFQGLTCSMPPSLVKFLADYMPSKSLDRLRNAGKVADGIAKTLIDSKNDALLQEKGKYDVMSLLVKANAATDEKARMRDDEMVAQMRTILLAGHETTSTTLSWTLYELSRHKEMQNRVRAEIRSTEQALGSSGFTWADLEGLSYTTAVVKEVLRCYPIVYHTFREPKHDDVLPLSKPITTLSGRVITELPVGKGTTVLTSIYGYNRNKDIFGNDADVFNPERWMNGLKDKKGATAGVYANLLTFAGGNRSCIGWHFAVTELQAFIVELVNNFEFQSMRRSQRRFDETVALCLSQFLRGRFQREHRCHLKSLLHIERRYNRIIVMEGYMDIVKCVSS